MLRFAAQARRVDSHNDRIDGTYPFNRRASLFHLFDAVRIYHAEEFARGKEITEAGLQTIGAEASRVVEPIDDLRGSASYKRQLVGVLVRRALAAMIQ